MSVRLNKHIATLTGLSRRAADTAIQEGRVQVNDAPAQQGQQIEGSEKITIDGQQVSGNQPTLQTILLNKPRGYVVSRQGQGSKTVYDLLPKTLHHLKPIGRLDKDSSGLLLLTNDGNLAEQLTHPRYQKIKIYDISLNKPLAPLHRQMIADFGIQLDDGLSKLGISRIDASNDDLHWRITMSEGRNRQIRRTFAALGYTVVDLHRIQFGAYNLPSDLQFGKYITVQKMQPE